MPLTRAQRAANHMDPTSRSSKANDSIAITSKTVQSRAPLGDVSNKRKADSSSTVNSKKKKSITTARSVVQRVKDAVLLPRESKLSHSRSSNCRQTKESVKPRRRSPRLSGEHVANQSISIHSSSSSSSLESSTTTTKSNVSLPPVDDPNLLVQKRYRLTHENFDGGLKLTSGIAAHDEDKLDDALMVAPYLADVYQNLYFEESVRRLGVYMQDQQDINAKMRSILVDWLVEVHMKFRLVPETLYLCVNIIDRYCSKVTNIRRSKLQLVGVTALLIACKYEEIYPPEVRDCVYITDRAYDRQQVILMEQEILNKLEWKVTVPTAYPFLVRFLNICKATKMETTAANYFLERTLQEHDMLRFRGSLIAAACVLLAINCDHVFRQDHQRDRINESEPGFPQILKEYTNFNELELRKCMYMISQKVSEEPVTMSNRQLIAVKRKYDQEKYSNISALPPPYPNFHF